MYYKIGTLAKRFGITTQAIRFYEKQGLLFSRFEEDSNTRRYHTRNIKWLSSIRRYHEMGFGMKEIQQLFLCEKPEELNMQMNAHEEKLLVEIAEREKMLAAVRRQKQDIARIDLLQGRCVIEPSPMFWLLIDQEGQHLDESASVSGIWDNWIHDLAHVYSAVVVDAAAIYQGSELEGRKSGYLVEEDTALALGLAHNDCVQRVQYNLCIHTIAPKEKIYQDNELRYVPHFAKEHGYELIGKAIARCLCKVGEVHCQDEQIIPSAIYYEYWIPVKKCEITDD